MHKILKENSQSISNILSQIILNGTNFAMIVLFTHFLNPDDYGIVSLYLAYTLFVSTFIGLKVDGSINIAMTHLEREKQTRYLTSILVLSLISFVVTYCITVYFAESIEIFTGFNRKLIIILLIHSFGQTCFSFCSIYYIFTRQAEKNLKLSFFIAVSMICLSYLGIYWNCFDIEDYMVRILSIAIPYMLCIIFTCYHFLNFRITYRIIKESILFCLPISIPLIFHGFSHIILAQTDKIMLQKILYDNATVGIYSFITTFTHVINTIAIALNNTWVPIFYALLKSSDYKTIIKRSKNYGDIFLVLFLGFLMVSPEVVYLLADKKYWNGLNIFPILALSIYIVFLYFFPVNYELYKKKSKIVAVGTMGAALLNIVFNYYFIPKYGMLGAAIATLLSYLGLLGFHIYMSKKVIQGLFPYTSSFFMKYIGIAICGCCIYYGILQYSYIRWIIAVLLLIKLINTIKVNKKIF